MSANRSDNKVTPGEANGPGGSKSSCNYYHLNNILENEITLSKKTFVNVHSAENIRDDYLIGKVLGSGKIYNWLYR
jgi:hypothetical protein